MMEALSFAKSKKLEKSEFGGVNIDVRVNDKGKN
jgi:hypothetical protein